MHTVDTYPKLATWTGIYIITFNDLQADKAGIRSRSPFQINAIEKKNPYEVFLTPNNL